MTVSERFLRYVAISTPASETGEGTPSSQCQFDLARVLADDMKLMGLTNVRLTDNCFVYGELPATEGTFASYVDGSVAMLMAEEERAAELGLKPIGRVLGFASAAGAPDNRWEPAVKAAAKLSAKFPEIAPESLTHIEVIADSAASTKAITEGLGLYGFKAEAVNPVGGSLAYGVNEGSDGVIAAGRALLNLRKTGAKYGLITAAMSGGQGMAMLIEAL